MIVGIENIRLMFVINFRQLDHPNIVGFRGSKVMPNQQVVLAMENCDTSLGNVVEIRSEESLGPLESSKILKVSVVLSLLSFNFEL